MYLTLEARTPCRSCGCLITVVMTGKARVNRKSVRLDSTLTGMPRSCPECGCATSAGLMPCSPWKLCEEDAVKVAEYRERKWGMSPGLSALGTAVRHQVAGRVAR